MGQKSVRVQKWLCGRVCLRYHEAMLLAAVPDKAKQPITVGLYQLTSGGAHGTAVSVSVWDRCSPAI